MSEQVLCACGCEKPAPIATKTDIRRGHVKGEPSKYLKGHYQRMVLSRQSAPLEVQRCTDAEMEFTEQDIANLRTTDDLVAADLYDARLMALEKLTKRTFIEIGMICLEVKRRELWKKIIAPDWTDDSGRLHHGEYFHSIDAWIYSRLGVSRTSAYDAMRVLGVESVSLDDLREMPRRNARRLANLSSAVQCDPAVIEAAKGSEKGFIEVVQKNFPGQHFEAERSIIAKPTLSAREQMTNTFDVVRWVYDVENREDILELLCVYFMDGKCEREGYTNWTNEEAFEAAKKRGVA